ncbi:MAG: potassium channel family protein [Streptosporangiaceae bacterium]
MKRAAVLLAAAAASVAGWGAVFSATQHAGILTGLYWAVTTATTVGYGDVTVHGADGRLLAIGCMLTAIPLLAAAFGQLHLDRVRTALGEHHKAIHDRLDRIEQGSGSEGEGAHDPRQPA